MSQGKKAGHQAGQGSDARDKLRKPRARTRKEATLEYAAGYILDAQDIHGGALTRDTALLFELARRAQAARLRRRRRAQRADDDANGGGNGMDDAPRLSPTQRRGTGYEERALALLVRGGLLLLARNLRCRAGEIDLAMRDGDMLVLVEVRARASRRFGGAAASVDRAKQDRLVRAAQSLLPRLTARHWPGRTPRVRFDVIAFEGDEPVWLRDAFDAGRK
jgi:putative endonuclease